MSRLGGGNETQHQSLVIGHWSLVIGKQRTKDEGRRTKDKNVGWVEVTKPNINQLVVWIENSETQHQTCNQIEEDLA